MLKTLLILFIQIWHWYYAELRSVHKLCKIHMLPFIWVSFYSAWLHISTKSMPVWYTTSSKHHYTRFPLLHVLYAHLFRNTLPRPKDKLMFSGTQMNGHMASLYGSLYTGHLACNYHTIFKRVSVTKTITYVHTVFKRHYKNILNNDNQSDQDATRLPQYISLAMLCLSSCRLWWITRVLLTSCKCGGILDWVLF